MPKLAGSEIAPKELSVMDIVKENLSELREASDELGSRRKIICTFFRDGKHPDCATCIKWEEKVEDCTNDYVSKIMRHPQLTYSKEFDSVKIRDKVPVSKIKEFGMICDRCYMSEKCTLFEEGSTCAVDWGEEFPNEKVALDYLISLQTQRIKRASVFEEVDGGVPDANLSNEIDRLTGLLETKADMHSNKVSVKISAESTERLPNGGNGGGSILQQIFGNSLKKAEPQESLPENSITDAQIIDNKEPEKIKIKKNGPK